MKRFLALLAAGGIALSALADSSLVFNEIMYHPQTNEAAMEWVEVYNQMAVDLDISGWSLDGGVHYTFASNTIIHGGAYLVVAVSPATLIAATGLTNVVGPFIGRLSNSGETLQLKNNSGRVVDTLTYGVDGDWPVAAATAKGVPFYLPLDPFIVNLADKEADRYLQIGITFELESSMSGDTMKGYMPDMLDLAGQPSGGPAPRLTQARARPSRAGSRGAAGRPRALQGPRRGLTLRWRRSVPSPGREPR